MPIELSGGWTLALGLAILAIGALHAKQLIAWIGKSKKLNVGTGVVLMVVSLVFIAGAFQPTILSSLTGGALAPTQALSFGGGVPTGDSNDGDLTTTDSQIAIGTLSVFGKEKYSNSPTAFSGILEIYGENVNPSGANAQPIETVNVNSGVGSTTDKIVRSNTNYRVVFNGNGSTYYDKDFGVIQFDNFDAFNSIASFDLGEIAQVATIADMLDETSTDVNGQTGCGNNTAASEEILCSDDTASADDTLIYDESVGDGSFYLDITLSVSGSQSEARETVLEFQHDSTNPPEGNEFDEIFVENRAGSAIAGMPDDLLSYWQNELPVELGDMRAGRSSDYRLTFSIVEANSDANDDWTLNFDDLGSYLGKDVKLDKKATADTITWGGSQS